MQGDWLDLRANSHVAFPDLQLPISSFQVAVPKKGEGSRNDPQQHFMTVRVRQVCAIVVSHDCTNENQVDESHVVSLAPIVPYAVRPERAEAAFETLRHKAPEFQNGTLKNYNARKFLVGPNPPGLQLLPTNVFWMADLTRITSFHGPDSELRLCRRGRLDEPGRLRLGEKISILFSREPAVGT